MASPPPFILRGRSSAHSQLDEGYSEETRSQPDSEMMYTTAEEALPDAQLKHFAEAINGLPMEERKHVLMECIKTLPNSQKVLIKQYIEVLTHFDPAAYLPAELLLEIFAYLSPSDLLKASATSHQWRQRAFDEKLWRACFAREGWVLDRESTAEFERMAAKKGRRIAEGILRNGGKSSTKPTLERKESRKRSRGEAFNEGEGSRAAIGLAVDGAAEDALQRESEETQQAENMEGVETMSTADPTSDSPGNEDDPNNSFHTSSSADNLFASDSPTDFKLRPTIYQTSGGNLTPKLSWPYLYKQRRRLEANWETGQYKMFQLPHPDHLDEGHAECVYTIQHTAKHLVSGSRDRTIRIWDLQTYRLKGQPLRGHSASVLCLQFDERPEQDIIVSGGSDSSIIVWKFSTGTIIKHLEHAHSESVLNLRFDDRYIVTCSKDKTIKIWSRHALARDSELIPHKVLQDFADPSLAPRGGLGAMIEPFTHLSTVGGHNAAVNAVMIHDNTIVSASGDRTVKAWDILTGELKKSYVGHTKGIACVQFDGRRVVSGSSDNTVRIFDSNQMAEVACLTGHSNLVRTVQARFGDIGITSDEELEAEARQATKNFYRAVARGMTPAPVNSRSVRNAGSSRPEDLLAVGTKVPPGGGGTRWARIVSGSYDETVIVWKKDPENGKWIPKLHLHQDMMMRSHRRRHLPALPQPANAGQGQAQQNAQNVLATAQHHLTQVTNLLAQPGLQQGPQLQNAQGQLAQLHAALQNPTAPQPQQQQQQQNNPQPAPAAPAPQQQNNNNNANGNPPPHQQQQEAAPAPAAAAAPNLNAHAQGSRDSSRIFKLQFDARRIICCSQNKTIVGWDFANGDRELEKIGEWSLETC